MYLIWKILWVALILTAFRKRMHPLFFFLKGHLLILTQFFYPFSLSNFSNKVQEPLTEV